MVGFTNPQSVDMEILFDPKPQAKAFLNVNSTFACGFGSNDQPCQDLRTTPLSQPIRKGCRTIVLFIHERCLDGISRVESESQVSLQEPGCFRMWRSANSTGTLHFRMTADGRKHFEDVDAESAKHTTFRLKASGNKPSTCRRVHS